MPLSVVTMFRLESTLRNQIGWLFIVCPIAILFLSSCRNELPMESREFAYSSEAVGELRDQLGPKSKVIGRIANGEKLLILERLNRWARVRVVSADAAEGQPLTEGWMHQRQMVSQQVFEQFQELAKQSADLPSQGGALVRRLANMRLQPGRTTQAFYQLATDEQVEVLRHSIKARPATAEEVRRGTTEPIPEDWLLVRASKNRTGWILESLAEMVPPLEVARYRESQRIRAWFKIFEERDEGQTRPWFLWATVPKLTGAPHDFEEIRVFVWNPAADRYETSYRERNLVGFLPINVALTKTPTGDSPEFYFEHQNTEGERVRRTYFMLGRQVRLKRD
jgi:hypothetical protein